MAAAGRETTGADAADWTLDPRLAGDGMAIADLALCRLILVDDATFPWLVLVPRRPGAVEIIDLAEADQQLLMAEIAAVSRALKHATACDKLNVAALGNAVRQLHVHIVARFAGDPAGLRPIWGIEPPLPRRPYPPDAKMALAGAVLRGLGHGADVAPPAAPLPET